MKTTTTTSPNLGQHTPGPWHSEGYPRYVDPTVVSPDGPVCAISTGPLDRTLPRKPAAANARLIAAAPELLAALVASAELAEGAIKLLRQLDMESGRIAAECVLRDARAAIAKATGGAA